MPGEFGDYTAEEVRNMGPEDLYAAAQRGWTRAPSIVDVQLPPSPNVWASRKSSGGKDFTCPSGQTCRLRPLDPEVLLKAGLLDKVTRLEGLADALVKQAEGAPPEKQHTPTRQELMDLLELLDLVVPMAVAEPKVYSSTDKEAPEGAITVSDIDLDDRMAIVEESLRGIRALDAFRRPR